MFGESSKEKNRDGEEIGVFKTPKYQQARALAAELVEKNSYGLTENDFWIQKNLNKAGSKMIYSGLIISHNGCLKINDQLSSKFKPEYASFDKLGYGNSLVFTYNCPEQGILEVGEVNPSNCKISYPYAMALKRLFDRVVLKLSKLAYDGIYSDTESDEFAEDTEARIEKEEKTAELLKRMELEPPICPICGKDVKPTKCKGETVTAQDFFSQYGMCLNCLRNQNEPAN